MIQIITLPTGFLAANCYIVYDDSSGGRPGVVIDPGSEASRILAMLKDEKITGKAVFITHGHYDHVGAVADVSSEFRCPVFMSKADLEIYSGQSEIIASFGGDLHDVFEFFEDGQEYAVSDGLKLRVVFTPGHSPGGVCIAVPAVKALFTGDTLFEGTVGRTDLPGSSPKALKDSLRRISTEFTDFTVYPGHDSATTMKQEMEKNPFLLRL